MFISRSYAKIIGILAQKCNKIFFYFTQCLIFNILISHVDLIGEYCVFKCVHGKCPVKQKLSRRQPDGARLRNIIDASIQYGDSMHVDLQEQLDANENL